MENFLNFLFFKQKIEYIEKNWKMLIKRKEFIEKESWY